MSCANIWNKTHSFTLKFADVLSEVKEESQEQASGTADIKKERKSAPDLTSPNPQLTQPTESAKVKRGGGFNHGTSSSHPFPRVDGSDITTGEVMAFQSNATVPAAAAEPDAGIQYRLQGTFTR